MILLIPISIAMFILAMQELFGKNDNKTEEVWAEVVSSELVLKPFAIPFFKTVYNCKNCSIRSIEKRGKMKYNAGECHKLFIKNGTIIPRPTPKNKLRGLLFLGTSMVACLLSALLFLSYKQITFNSSPIAIISMLCIVGIGATMSMIAYKDKSIKNERLKNKSNNEFYATLEEVLTSGRKGNPILAICSSEEYGEKSILVRIYSIYTPVGQKFLMYKDEDTNEPLARKSYESIPFLCIGLSICTIISLIFFMTLLI